MICNNCKQKLPDDSEFCQYCGTKIEIDSTQQVMDDILQKASSEDISAEELLDAFMKFQAKQTVDAMEANAKSQTNHESDAAFGLTPEKPVFTPALKSVSGEKEYLNKLRTVNGDKISYERTGSISTVGVHGITDIYDTFLPSGELYKRIYINMYGAKGSQEAPAGFILMNENTKKSAKKKTRYCSRCGSLIDNETKICSGCGKKYFGGKRITSHSITVFTLILIIIAISSLCIVQRISMSNTINDEKATIICLQEEIAEQKGKITDFEQEVESKDTTIYDLRKKIEELGENGRKDFSKVSFFDRYVAIVILDGTNMYHKWECPKLDTHGLIFDSNTNGYNYKIYSIDEAADNYSKCPLCH